MKLKLLINLVIISITTVQLIMANSEDTWIRQSSLTLHFILQSQVNGVIDIVQENDSYDLLETYSILSKTRAIYPTFTIQTYNMIQKYHESNSSMFFKILETTLRNRWKVNRWRFNQTVLISSEFLAFSSKALQLYGPNVSENAVIFVSMTNSSFTAQNGRTKFQRDTVYRKVYAKLVLIIYADVSINIHVICILCKNALSPNAIQLTKEQDVSSVSTSMNSLHREFNIGKGHKSVARLCQVGFRGVIADTDYHKNLEITAKWKYDKNADKIGVIFGILINRFNFTVNRESWEELQGNYSGIYLNPGGDMPEAYIYGRQLTLAYIISEFLLYCRKVPVISSTGWDFLWTPFDYITWGFICITGVLFSIYHRGQVSYGVDVFWGVLGVPFTSNWTKSKFLSCFLVVLLNLNVGYLSVITSKVIIPNREADLETPAELFRQGFRFIDGNISVGGPNFMKYWGKYLVAARINTTVQSEVLVQVDTCGGTHDPGCIAKWAGLATGVLYEHKKTEALLSFPVNIRDRCHGVKTPLRSYWVSFYSQGPLASIIYDTHQALIATGIDAFWEKLQKASSVYDAYREANHTATNELPKLNFETPVLVVFKAYGVLITLCIISFPIEAFYFCIWTRHFRAKSMEEQDGEVPFKENRMSHFKFLSNGISQDPVQPRIILVSNFGNVTFDNKPNMMRPRVEVVW